jgi:hypothetical protein
MKYQTHDLDIALVAFFDAMRKSYYERTGTPWNKPWNDSSGKARFDIYADKPGQKFLRIIHDSQTQRFVHSFVVLKDCVVKTMPGSKNKTISLKVGDLLMSAGWKKPALNAVRGNILVPDYGTASWTGAGYLK